MTSQDSIARAASRLTDAMRAAADVMRVADGPGLAAKPGVRHARGWLLPLAAAASVVVIALAAVFLGHLAASPATRGGTGDGAVTAPPEFYLTASWTSGKLLLAVHRTADGAVTATAPVPGTMPQTGYLTADAGDRAFFIATFPCTTAPTVSTFYRIVITATGQISGVGAVGSPVRGEVTDLAVSPDGSQLAYGLQSSGRCADPGTFPMPQGAVHIMDLSTGAVRTWQNTARAAIPAQAAKQWARLLKAEHASPDATVLRNLALVRNSVGGLSWAPGGHMLIVGEYWTFFGQSPVRPDLAVVGLDTASSGGSLQAHSRLLFLQGQNCVTCVQEAIAGPGDSLTAVALRAAGTQRTRLLVVRIPPTGGPRTVLYTALSPTPMADDWTAIFADPSGQWVIAWPLYDADKTGWESIQAGWISGGTLHPLPGTTLLFENGLAW